MNKGVSFFELLLILFITLKLCKVIAWSWWWVLSPFWIIVLIVFMLAFIKALLEVHKTHKW